MLEAGLVAVGLSWKAEKSEDEARREKIWLNIFTGAHVGICSRDMAKHK